MLLGTASHVGKSLLTTALCRIFHQHGVAVAPFKSQNMSLNSAATPDGYEIGRAQALQAEAARVAPSVDMNPILLKPAGAMTSQVVVRGRIWGRLSAADYHLRRVEELMPVVEASYAALATLYRVMVLEGAGSPAEINLKQHDIVNMRVAAMADASCLLVGDIDRGGVFASLLGTMELLEPAERERVRGFAINKFRGDVSLLEPGLRMMEARLGIPCVGVVPHLPGLTLDEEDSLGLPEVAVEGWNADHDPERRLRIAVIALPSLANFTDLDALRAEPSVDLRLVRTAGAAQGADVVLIPGSKQTADDLAWLRAAGLDTVVMSQARDGLVVGVCGGMQMLGLSVDDPLGIESGGRVDGLGLLPLRTTMQAVKTTVLSSGRLLAGRLFGVEADAVTVSGYEIHVGATVLERGAQAFALIADEAEGCVDASSRVFGSYLHGLFDEDAFRHLFLRNARAFHRLASARDLRAWRLEREMAMDAWAAHVERSLDMRRLFGWVGIDYRPERGA